MTLHWMRERILPLALALVGIGPTAAASEVEPAMNAAASETKAAPGATSDSRGELDGEAASAASHAEAGDGADAGDHAVDRDADKDDEPAAHAWTAREAEHLLNRAGFGATPAEVAAAVAAGRDATIEGLFLPPELQVPLEVPEKTTFKDGLARPDEMDRDDARRMSRRLDRDQLNQYTSWWFDTMQSGADPLRDRMTLFWHGYFTSSQRDVRSSYQMIQQNQLLRANALGSFEELLFGIAKDPAMLEYLDNDENKKGNPNENFAREVMELFTLGEGHYTEDDIKEAARAFTGWRSRRGEFREQTRQHDTGKKTILGETGRFDGDDVLEMLLRQDECGPHVAGRLLAYLEGVEPSPERKAHYGALLAAADYDVGTLLRELFRDPHFYSDAVVGQRVAGPIDHLVGMSRRLELDPPDIWLTYGTELLGQELFNPPNVKGWPGGMAWITTASFMHRGNLAGILLGTVEVGDLIEGGTFGEDMAALRDLARDAAGRPAPRGDGDEGMTGDVMSGEGEMMTGEMSASTPSPADLRRLGQLSRLKRLDRSWTPKLRLERDLARGRTPDEVVDGLADLLLAVELPPETRAFLIDEYQARLAELPNTGRRSKDRRNLEELLRSFAHLILSLPEAQLN